MTKLILIIKGFIIGAANVVPGVSGGTIMMSLGVFEDIIHSVNHFFTDVKKNSIFLINILIGLSLSIIIMSRLITFSLERYNFQTILFFIGLIVGGFPMLIKNIYKEKKKKTYVLSFIVPFVLVILLSLFNSSIGVVSFNSMGLISYVLLFLVGLIAASSMVVPGLSGSFMLILFGYYEPIMNSIKDFTSFNNLLSNGLVLFVFGLGVLFGLFLIIRLIEFLLAKYKVGTYYTILGFVFSSVISICITNFNSGIDVNVLTIIMSIILFLIGCLVTFKLGEKN